MDYTANICIDHFTPDQRRKLEGELELSQKVQKALLPQAIPEIPGLEVAAFSQPARIVGGDYFDFFRFQDAMPGILIADVMGKGVAASLSHGKPASVAQNPGYRKRLSRRCGQEIESSLLPQHQPHKVCNSILGKIHSRFKNS